jgi:hypothetical protein
VDDRKQASVGYYTAAWNETDPVQRMSELEQGWTDDAVYIDDDVPDGLVGPDALSTYIAEEHDGDPGLLITISRPLVVLGDRGWLQWVANSPGGAESSGTDFIEFAPDGRIARLTDFLDEAP